MPCRGVRATVVRHAGPADGLCVVPETGGSNERPGLAGRAAGRRRRLGGNARPDMRSERLLIKRGSDDFPVRRIGYRVDIGEQGQ